MPKHKCSCSSSDCGGRGGGGSSSSSSSTGSKQLQRHDKIVGHNHLKLLASSAELSQGDQVFTSFTTSGLAEHSKDSPQCLLGVPPAQRPHHESRELVQSHSPAIYMFRYLSLKHHNELYEQVQNGIKYILVAHYGACT